MFFSEEKNQKTFNSWCCFLLRNAAFIGLLAQKQKSFGSFLQKRTYLLFAVAGT
jgi:hypothetical protein